MAYTGSRPSRIEDVEEVDFLLSQHQGVAYILHALGARNAKSVARNMARYGRPDLARVFNTESTLVLEFPDEKNLITT